MKEIHDIAGYFIALLSPDANACGTSVDTLMRSSLVLAPKSLVRTKAGLIKYWKWLEGQYRTAVVAQKVEGPVVERVLKEVGEGNMEAVKETIQKLPGWKDRLREVTIAPLQAALDSYLSGSHFVFQSCVGEEGGGEANRDKHQGIH